MIVEHRLLERCGEVLLSPVVEQPEGDEIAGAEELSLRTLAEWVLEDGLQVRVQPQLHKFIWGAATRGV